MSCLKRHKTLFEKEKFVTHEHFKSIEFEEFWYQWNSSTIHFSFNESYLSSMNSEIYEGKDIKEWASHLSNNVSDLQIISWDKLYPLYELLDDDLKQKVKAIFGINNLTKSTKIEEKVLMSGVIKITDSFFYIVKFPYELNSIDYHIFGRLITQEGKPIDAIIKFKAMTTHSFIVWIDIDKTVKSIHSNLQIFWIMTGLPEIGFYSPSTRDVTTLASGSFEFAYARKLEIILRLPENIPTNWILCTSFQYFDCIPSFTATTIQYDKDSNQINVTIQDDSDVHISKFDQIKKYYCFHWCIISEDHEILPDVLKSREALTGVTENHDMPPENLDDISNSKEISADILPGKRYNLNSIGQDVYEKPKEPEYGVLSQLFMIHYQNNIVRS
ncbi:28621_t:CDS:2 [Dentiscutata erythropus]|uniref:28621_t:CDS:1 n=1 Tax=Dentiscutata erythropus TaxID=1348616 RepID=A0A9N9BWU5_9GLOM|nr:28621_t:CDS:2 [Dentiscutata erythropus]